MTFEEAKRIIDACRDDYHCFERRAYQIDGIYTLEELEALLVLAREADRTEVAA